MSDNDEWTYDPFLKGYHIDQAVKALNNLVLYKRKVLPQDSDLGACIDEVDHLINGCQDAVKADPYSKWVGVENPNPPLVPCEQCEASELRPSAEATLLAPRIKNCPTPDDPDRAYTYEYVAICPACSDDWWGPNESDRPEGAPLTRPLPINIVPQC